MRQQGFVSNRIFDVLASGGVVISDPVDGLEDLFGDLVPTYRSADELKLLVSQLISDTERRAEIASKGTELVAAQHTFDQRAHQLVELLKPMLQARAKNLGGDLFELSD